MTNGTFNQQTLTAAIKGGRRDFPGISIASAVVLSLEPSVQSLIFDGADLGPYFKICAWRNPEADLSMIGTMGEEISLNTVQIRSFGISLLGSNCWLQLQNCSGNSISLADSVFKNGLMISDSWANVLDLSRVQSNRTYLNDATWFRSIIETAAQLGERQPITLGEHMTQQATA